MSKGWFRVARIGSLPFAWWPVHWMGYLLVLGFLVALLSWLFVAVVLGLTRRYPDVVFGGLVIIAVGFLRLVGSHSTPQ